MKTFLVTYHATASAVQSMMTATPEQIQEATKPWMDWKDRYDEHVVNFGSRLLPGTERSRKTDFISSDSEVTGFSILKADDRTALDVILKDHPQLYWDDECRISVYEFLSM